MQGGATKCRNVSTVAIDGLNFKSCRPTVDAVLTMFAPYCRLRIDICMFGTVCWLSGPCVRHVPQRKALTIFKRLTRVGSPKSETTCRKIESRLLLHGEERVENILLLKQRIVGAGFATRRHLPRPSPLGKEEAGALETGREKFVRCAVPCAVHGSSKA